MRRAALERLAAEVGEYAPAPKPTLTVVPDPPLNRRQARIAQHTRVPARYLPAPAQPKRPGPGVGIGLGRLAVAATRGVYQCHKVLWDHGPTGRTVAVALAITEVAALGHAFGVDPATQAPETHQTHHPHTRTLEPTKPSPRPSPRHTEPHHQAPAHHRAPPPTTGHARSVHATSVLAARGPAWHNRAVAMRYLMDHERLTDFQAAALIGGFCVEADGPELDPGIHQRGGPAIGIVQWEGPRQEALLAFARTRGLRWDSLQTQLEFISHELHGSEYSAYTHLVATRSVEEAADVAINRYERPAKRIVAPRLAYAVELLDAYHAAMRH